MARRLPRQATTKAIERDYAKRLYTVIDAVEEELQEVLDELPELLASIQIERQIRADADEGRRIRELMGRVRDRVQQRISINQIESLAEDFASRTDRFNREQLRRQLRPVLGVTVLERDARLASLTEAFVSQNVSLIQDLSGKAISDAESTLLRGLQRGTSHRDLTEQLQQRLGIARKRASGIARDQIGSLNGQINAARQQSLGIKRFTWRTLKDERVRESHEDREGNIYSFDDPPDGELPGEPINCRCYAEPVISDIL